MADVEALKNALVAAHNAGDTEAATLLAEEIKAAKAQSTSPQAAPAPVAPPAAPVPARPTTVGDVFGAARDAYGAFNKGRQNIAAGGVRGAASIGSTILGIGDYIADKVTGAPQQDIRGLISGEQPMSRNEARRASVDEGLAAMGADPNSWQYGLGKIGTEIAGTLGVAPAAGAGLLSMFPKAAPLATAISSGGFTAGNVAKTAPAAAKVANMATRVAGGAISGGASAGLVDPKNMGTGAMIGGAIPVVTKTAGVIGDAANTAARNAVGQVSPEVRALAERAKQLGIDIPADRIVNSRPMNAVAETLNYVPFSGRAATEAKMTSQLTRAASRLIGQDSDNMALALRKASNDLGAKFDDVLRNNAVAVDDQMLQELADISQSASRELGQDGLKAISNQIDEIIAKGQAGKIDGQAAYNIKRTLDRIAKRNTPEAYHALELKRALMGALDRSLGPEKAAEFALTRQQYGNMIALEKIAKNGVEGEISVARLANLPNINNEPLQEIADIAAQFIKPREGQHGAMQRAVVGLVGAGSTGPVGFGLGVGSGIAANKALNSEAVRNYVLREPAAQGVLPMLQGKEDIVSGLLRAIPVVAGRP